MSESSAHAAVSTSPAASCRATTRRTGRADGLGKLKWYHRVKRYGLRWARPAPFALKITAVVDGEYTRLGDRLAAHGRRLGSHMTHRWREMDSNFRFRVRKLGIRLELN